MLEWELPIYDPKKCIRCGTCVQTCPQHVLEMGAQGPFFARAQDCVYCAQCEDACPQGALVCSYEIGWVGNEEEL